MFKYKTINMVEIEVYAENDVRCKEEVIKLLEPHGFKLIKSEIRSNDVVLECNEENIKIVFAEFFAENMKGDMRRLTHWIATFVSNYGEVDSVTVVLASEYNDEGYDYSWADIIPWDKNGNELMLARNSRVEAKLAMDHERGNERYYLDYGLSDFMKRKFPSSDKEWEYYFYENPITDFTIENFQQYMEKYTKK